MPRRYIRWRSFRMHEQSRERQVLLGERTVSLGPSILLAFQHTYPSSGEAGHPSPA